MPELESKVTTLQVDYVCDDCGKGEMQFTGKVSTNVKGVSSYHHVCDNPKCPHKANLANEYPYLIQEKVQEKVQDKPEETRPKPEGPENETFTDYGYQLKAGSKKSKPPKSE